MRADKNDKILTLSFGYGWDEKYGYIYKCVLKIDLSSATFYSGYWSRGLFGNEKWQQYGKKEEITIEDKNGMNLTYTGEQNYNRGTKQDLISKIVISFGTEPIANRIINEIYSIQANYKAKEPWLLPEQELQEVNNSSASKRTSTKSTSTMKKPSGSKRTSTKSTSTMKKPSGSSKKAENKSTTTKKVGKYVQ